MHGAIQQYIPHGVFGPSTMSHDIRDSLYVN